MSGAQDHPRGGFIFRKEVGVGEVATFLMLGIGGLGFVWNQSSEAKVTQQNLAQFQQSVAQDSTNLQRQIELSIARLEGTLAKLEQQTRSIPDLSARMTLTEQQVRDSTVRAGTQDQAIDTIRQRIYEVSAELEALKRASGVALPGRPAR